MKNSFLFLFYFFLLIGCKKTVDEPAPPTPPVSKTPVVVTNPITSITLFSATLSGKLIDTAGSKVTELGLVADTLPNPTITRNVNKFIQQANNNGEFSTIVTQIPANNKWYVRAYAINSYGTGYGKEETFNSPAEKVFFGNATLTNQQEVNSFGANNYTTIRGSIFISGPVTDLSPLRSIVIIGNGFEVANSQITSFAGLENLEIIGDDFIHSFLVERNPSLINFSGLNKLKIINGDFLVYNNDALVNFLGLDNLFVVQNFQFDIYDCDHLTSLQGLEKLLYIGGELNLKNNPLLSDLRALRNLRLLLYRLRIIDHSSLQKIDAFENIKKLGGIELINNASLSDISGFRNIDTASEVILIDNNDMLTNLSAFNNITTTEYITIKNNAALTDLEGFKNVQSLKYQLLIENNNSLTNLQGLRRLKFLERLEIFSNGSLQNLNGLDSLTSITGNVYSITIYSKT